MQLHYTQKYSNSYLFNHMSFYSCFYSAVLNILELTSWYFTAFSPNTCNSFHWEREEGLLYLEILDPTPHTYLSAPLEKCSS